MPGAFLCLLFQLSAILPVNTSQSIIMASHLSAERFRRGRMLTGALKKQQQYFFRYRVDNFYPRTFSEPNLLSHTVSPVPTHTLKPPSTS